MEWIPNRKKLPDRLEAFDVTLRDKDNFRCVSVALFRPENSTWTILWNKDEYRDYKIVAWKPMSEPYQGAI